MYKQKDGFKPDICDKDEQCRYRLGKKGKTTLICIGANPSVASGGECDATINNLCSILQNNGYDGFVMLNLYPLIATNPDELADFDEKIHAKNLAKIKAVLAEYKNSDILLLKNDLLSLKYAIKLSKDTYKIIKQNLILSLAYNAFTIPLAFLGLINPLIAALSMSFSILGIMQEVII